MSHSATKTKFRLCIERQSASDIEHCLEDGRSVFIGNSNTCGIQLKGDGIAGIHCLVEANGDQLFVQDWASECGTKINGQSIEDKTELHVGDKMELGSTTIIVRGNAASEKMDGDQESANHSAREAAIGMEHMGYDPNETSLPDLPDAASEELDAIEAVASITEELERVDEANEEPSDELTNSLEEQDDMEAELSDEPEELLHDAFAEELEDDFSSAGFSADDLDWDPSEIDDDQIDAEIVQLLKSEIEDLRIQVAERDEQLAALAGLEASIDEQDQREARSDGSEFEGVDLVNRVDHLLVELAEHDDKVATLQELLQTAEIQNQAEREERHCLESWVGEIEQRISERESEWQAEQDALRERLELVSEERDKAQQHLHAASQRYGAGVTGEVVPDETLEKLQQQNTQLQEELDASRKQLSSLAKHIERLESEEPEDVQQARAELAREKASVSRLRFQLSQQLQEINQVPEPKGQPDREFSHKLQTLRDHLREIHEEEKLEREQRGGSLFGRISNLWKTVEDRY